MVSLTAARLPSFKGLGRGTTGWTRSFKLTTPVYVTVILHPVSNVVGSYLNCF